jgi:uncharacterized protein (UPF0332 family)
MTFDWAEYLRIANVLAQLEQERIIPNLSSEAFARAAISRAYYAAFNMAALFLREKDFDNRIPTDGTAHFHVKDQFYSHPDKIRQRIGRLLNELSTDRRKADYEHRALSDAVPRMKTALRLSKEVIDLLKGL